jgi:phosphatidyl-myo-inositol dimannoside synthase
VRVLYVTHSFPLPGDPLSNVGGMQRVAVGLHEALAASPRIQLSTLALETSWKGTPYRMPGFMLKLLATLPARVERERIDAVLFSSMVTASVTALLKNALHRRGTLITGIPIGRDVTLPTPGYQRFVRRVLASLDVTFPISRATADECRQRGLAEDKIHVLPCGVDTGLFNAPVDRQAARGELLRAIGETPETVPDDRLILVSVGRHQERKGFQWFTDRVMPQLPEDVLYLVTGEGPMTPVIQAAVDRHGLAGRVRLLGKVPEDTLRVLYRGGDLFVMPNIHVEGDIEGFGVVMLEAGMCGLPVLAADLEGISDVVTEGANGHLLRSGDVDGFTGQVMRYRTDRDALGTASRMAAAHTAESFTWAAIADRMLDLIEERLPARRPAAIATPNS